MNDFNCLVMCDPSMTIWWKLNHLLMMKKEHCLQAMAALTEVIKQQKEKNPYMTRKNSKENINILLLSIGCGTAEAVGVDAQVAEHFSANQWAATGLATGAYDYGSKEMTEFYISTVFPGLQSSDYYLPIQVCFIFGFVKQ